MKTNKISTNLCSRLLLFIIALLGWIPFAVFGQDDFDNPKQKKIIAHYKIKEAISYLSPEGGSLADSTVSSHMFFNDQGLCVKEITPEYDYTFYYNANGQKIKEITKGKNKSDSSITVFNYDSRGNMIFFERIKESADIQHIFPDLTKHKFTYNSNNEVLKESRVGLKGEETQIERREYLTTGLDSGVLKEVKYYDMYNKPSYIKKFYTNNEAICYLEDNSIYYEQFFDSDYRVIKVIDHRHLGPHSFDMVKKFGHGIIAAEMVTELYKYGIYGLPIEKLIYKDGVLIERQVWYYKQ